MCVWVSERDTDRLGETGRRVSFRHIQIASVATEMNKNTRIASSKPTNTDTQTNRDTHVYKAYISTHTQRQTC